MRKMKMRTFLVVSSFLLLFTTSRGYAQKISSGKNDKTVNNTKIKNKMATNTVKAYASVNGLKMYYEIQGSGQPVIVLHGGFGNTELFMPNVTSLAKNHKLIFVDLQGHGRTADIDRPILPDSMANDIAALIKQLALGKTSVIGYSLGGMVALRLAIQHPELLDRVVLMSCPFKRKGWFPDLLAQQDQMSPASAEGLKQSPLYQSYVKVAPRPEDWTAFVTKMGAFIQRDYDWSREVAEIKLPILLVVADADGIMPAHTLEFFQLLGGGQKDAGWDGSARPASQLAIIPGRTHYDLFATPVLPAVIEPFLSKK